MRFPGRKTWLIVCLVFSSVFCAADVAAYQLHIHNIFSLGRILGGVLIFGLPTLFLGLPGVVLMLWMVEKFKDLRGRRFWLFLLFGSLLGPFSLSAMGWLRFWRHPEIGGVSILIIPSMVWAFSVSTLTTAMYLGVARYFHLYEPIHRDWRG